MAHLFQPSLIPAIDSNGRTISGAQLHFYLSGTTTKTPTFTSHDETAAHTNPVVANSAGRFPPVYLRETIVHRVRLTDANGVLLSFSDVDPVNVYDPVGPVVKYYRFGGFAIDAPLTDEVLVEHIATDAFTLPADMIGSTASVGVAPLAGWLLEVQRNGDPVGSIVYSDTGHATFQTLGHEPIPIAEGDVLSFVAPSEVDPQISRLRFTLKGVL